MTKIKNASVFMLAAEWDFFDDAAGLGDLRCLFTSQFR